MLLIFGPISSMLKKWLTLKATKGQEFANFSSGLLVSRPDPLASDHWAVTAQ